jgi:hypothetical protein
MSIRPSNPAQSQSSVVQRHPLACFFVLTYLAAWCLWAPPPPRAPAPSGRIHPGPVSCAINDRHHAGRHHSRQAWRTKPLGRSVVARRLRWYAVVLILPLLAPLGLA